MERRKRYHEERRRDVFELTRGKCHLCYKQLSFNTYGIHGARGAWHVDHSLPIARGGTNHLNNLRAACITCNLDKSTASSRTARSWHGKRRAPLSTARHDQAKAYNALGAGALGASIGGMIAGPGGAALGGLLGALLGHDADPDE
jgi:5-methylcytosine-specific restriction endonuclease McrA